jgi:hypothetical protein
MPPLIATRPAPTASARRLGGIALALTLGALLSGCHTAPPAPPGLIYNRQNVSVVTGVQPLAVQPDLTKWRALRTNLTEAEVTALLGNPYHKDPRPPANTNASMRELYAWNYGQISFDTFPTKGAFLYTVTFYEGRVEQISDPWNGQFSADGRPTVPELVLPKPDAVLDHYPRFLDFRWQPSSGNYPIEYEITVEALTIDQAEAEHYEDYIRRTVAENRKSWQQAGRSPREQADLEAGFIRHLREYRGVVESFSFRTQDIYVPLNWVGMNTGRWRIRATNESGASDWTAWRYFRFSK